MSDPVTVETVNGKMRLSGAGVTLEVPCSREFLEALAPHRPGLDLPDELLRSEHAPYIRDRLAVLVEPFAERRNWLALDFACGAGGSSVTLARLGIGRLIGVDLVNDYAKLWNRRLTEAGFPSVGSFVQAGDSLRLPFRDGGFDAVFLNGVLEHLLPDERVRLLTEALRLVRGEGYVFISETPNSWFPRNSHTKLWFSEWLPFALASRYAAAFGRRHDFPRHGKTEIFRTGFRGMSIPHVERILEGATLLAMSERVAEFEFVLPRSPLDASPQRTEQGKILWQIAVRFARLLGRSPAYFAPHINLVFQKTAG